MANHHIDLTGKKYNKLTVLSYAGTNKHRQARWLCQCDCGSAPKIYQGYNLKMGNSKSCGCDYIIAANKRYDKTAEPDPIDTKWTDLHNLWGVIQC